jgi:hypothetical protein
VHLRWRMIHEEHELFVDLRIGDDVQVIDNESDGMGAISNLVYELA